MTTLSTTDDLLRAARENTEFREAFRREILTDELLNLPRRFAEYAAETDRKIDALIEHAAETDRKIADLTDKVNSLTDAVSALTRNLAEYQKTTNERFDRMEEAIHNTRSELSKNIRSLHRVFRLYGKSIRLWS